jgi:hypothetical protein
MMVARTLSISRGSVEQQNCKHTNFAHAAAAVELSAPYSQLTQPGNVFSVET